MNESMPHILIVDDEPNIRKMLRSVLLEEGYGVDVAADADEAEAALRKGGVDLMLLDVLLPGTDGITLLRRLQERGSDLPVIMMSGHATIQTAVDATRLGAIDFIEKPLKVERVLLSMENGLRMHRLRAENTRLREALAPAEEIIGSSAAIKKLRDEIARAAPTDARVLITGENGTGKELVARALHAGSRRSERPFIKVNCAAIPAELLESELFGHERGAFTGAVAARRGKFELAQRGTLLLDEIGDMNPTTQAKLLRVLEEGELERLGGEMSLAIDVRVLSSTNQDLGRLLQSGGFREDLFHRLKVVPIHIPPLREHAADVDELARHYLDHFCAANGRRPKHLTGDALAALRAYGWPGNVRELKNLMERLVIMADSLEIMRENIQSLLGASIDRAEDPGEDAPLADRLEAFERRLVARAIEAAGGNVAEAARSLGLDRANLHRKIKRLGLDR
jgi:DNA-binding NtrC family response regulator